MKKNLFILFCLLSSLPLFSDMTSNTQDVLVKMDEIITAAAESLKKLQATKECLVEYKAAEKAAIDDPDNVHKLQKLVFLAKQLDDSIKENYLQDYLPSQFVEEISQLAKVYDKNTIFAPK